MGLKICSLFSGSTGNSTYIESAAARLLIDIGVTAGREEKALKALRCEGDDVSVLITHRHSDHIAGVPAFVRKYKNVKVYVHERTAYDLERAGVPARNICPFGDADFYIGDITVSPLPLSHDVFCLGFCLLSGGKKITVATDTGYMPAPVLSRAQDSDLVLIESNHSPELLRANAQYSYALKRRILGQKGHLSNEDCAAAVTTLARSGVKHFILAHLSKENNYPELAYSVCRDALQKAGFTQVELSVAFADRLGGLMEII